MVVEITVNARSVIVPDGSTGQDIMEWAIAAGIRPIKKGKGGQVELRGYLPSGGALLIGKNQRPLSGFKSGGHTYDIRGFGLTSVEGSNALGSGRGTYWPAKAGRLNPQQIAAAVAAADVQYSRIWKRHLVLSAPKNFAAEGKFSPAYWTRDNESMIIRNASGPQYDNYLTLTTRQGEKLIGLMIERAQSRLDAWALYRKGRAAKMRKLSLFPIREAHLRRVGYAVMSREWFAEKKTPANADRRDVDNQILAKYQRRKGELPGGQTQAQPSPPPALPKDYQTSAGLGDARSVRLSLKPRRGVFQQVDITKTHTPYGLAKLVVIHRTPRILRVFWHAGMTRNRYDVAGVSVPLTPRGTGRYMEGQPTDAQWRRLGIQ